MYTLLLSVALADVVLPGQRPCDPAAQCGPGFTPTESCLYADHGSPNDGCDVYINQGLKGVCEHSGATISSRTYCMPIPGYVAPEPPPAPPPAAPPKAPEPPPAARQGLCATTPGAGSLLAGLAMLFLASRRAARG